jgi:hypothetical protein
VLLYNPVITQLYSSSLRGNRGTSLAILDGRCQTIMEVNSIWVLIHLLRGPGLCLLPPCLSRWMGGVTCSSLRRSNTTPELSLHLPNQIYKYNWCPSLMSHSLRTSSSPSSTAHHYYVIIYSVSTTTVGEKREDRTRSFSGKPECVHTTRELPMTELRKVSTGASNSTTSDICIAHEPGPTVYII